MTNSTSAPSTAGGGIGELEEYIRFTIEHGDCGFEFPDKKRLAEVTGNNMAYNDILRYQMTCRQAQKMLDGTKLDGVLSLTAFTEGGEPAHSNYSITSGEPRPLPPEPD